MRFNVARLNVKGYTYSRRRSQSIRTNQYSIPEVDEVAWGSFAWAGLLLQSYVVAITNLNTISSSSSSSRSSSSSSSSSSRSSSSSSSSSSK